MYEDPYPPASDFTVGEAIGEGHKLLMANYGLMLGAAIVVVLLTAAAAMIAGIIDTILVGPDALFNPVSTAAQFLVQTPLSVGLGMLAVRRYRDGEGAFEDIFMGFKRYWPIVAIGFLLTMGMWVFMIAGIAGGALVVGVLAAVSTPAAIAVGVVLGIGLLVLLVYLAVRLWFSYLVCIDPRGASPGPIDSIKISWYLTSGRSFKVFLVGLIMGLIGFVCVLLLFLPFIFYALPLYACAFGALYVLLNPMPPQEGDLASEGEIEPMGPPPLGA